LGNFDTWALAETAAKLMVAHELGEFSEWFLVGWECRVEPSCWVIGFWIRVGNWVASNSQFDSMDNRALGDEVALVDIVRLEKTRDA
jgi:hypothetical protein